MTDRTRSDALMVLGALWAETPKGTLLSDVRALRAPLVGDLLQPRTRREERAIDAASAVLWGGRIVHPRTFSRRRQINEAMQRLEAGR